MPFTLTHLVPNSKFCAKHAPSKTKQGNQRMEQRRTACVSKQLNKLAEDLLKQCKSEEGKIVLPGINKEDSKRFCGNNFDKQKIKSTLPTLEKFDKIPFVQECNKKFKLIPDLSVRQQNVYQKCCTRKDQTDASAACFAERMSKARRIAKAKCDRFAKGKKDALNIKKQCLAATGKIVASQSVAMKQQCTMLPSLSEHPEQRLMNYTRQACHRQLQKMDLKKS
jgi:hypothetical protein